MHFRIRKKDSVLVTIQYIMILFALLGLINAEKSQFWLGHGKLITEFSNQSWGQHENCDVTSAIWEEMF